MTTLRSEPNGDVDEALIQRYVDGDLRGRDRVRVEALLAADADAFRTAMDFQRQNVVLKALHPRRVDDTMLPPAALGLARALHRTQVAQRLMATTAAFLLLVGAGAFGWKAQDYVRSLHRQTPVVAVFPTATPTVVSGTSGATPAAVEPAPGGDALASGAAERIAVHPPNLQTVGYQLVDGRADITTYGPVLRFAYEPLDRGGGRLSLTVAAFGADRRSLATSINPQHTSLFWQDGQHLFALSGAIEPQWLLKVADVVAAEGRALAGEPSPVAPLPAAPTVGATPGEEAPAPPADTPKDT